MFKKLLNVGKGHSSSERSHNSQNHNNNQLNNQQQQQQKSLFELNEIKSYGFTHLQCLAYSPKLSLLAVGSKSGLLRVLGNPSVEFSHQLTSCNSIRQIEFVHQRDTQSTNSSNNHKGKQHDERDRAKNVATKLVVLTDNGQLHLFELKNVKQLNFTDNTTQTDTLNNDQDCCRPPSRQQNVAPVPLAIESEFTTLEYVGHLDYFVFKLEDDDRSRRVTTLEISACGQVVYVGTEGGNMYQVPLDKFEPVDENQLIQDENHIVQHETGVKQILGDAKEIEMDVKTKLSSSNVTDEEETTAMNLNDEPQIDQAVIDEPFNMIKYEEDVSVQLGDEIKPKKQGAIESIKRHPSSEDKILVSYHRGLSVIYDVKNKQVDKYFYHNSILESSCFASELSAESFYTSHNDGSYIRWDMKRGSQSKADDDNIEQLYGPYPCKPTPKIQACAGLVNDQLEDLVVFSGGMPRATYDDKNPVTIVRAGKDGKDTIKVVLDLSSKVLDFTLITKPRGSLNVPTKTTSGGGGGKKGKNKQQQQQKHQQQHNQQIAVALAIMAEEEFVVVDLLNNESYLEFALPYLNCVQPSAITCNQHYSDVSGELYEQLLAYSKQQVDGKLSQNEWPIQGGKVINAPLVNSHDILLTGHEDGSVNMWDVSDLSMHHLLHIPTGKYFSTEDDELPPIGGPAGGKEDNSPNNGSSDQDDTAASWPPLKKVGRFDPFSDDTRLAVRKISLCPQSGTLLVAGTGGQVLLFELKAESGELETLVADEVCVVSDTRFTWKGREKLAARSGAHKLDAGYQLVSYVQLSPPAAATATDLRSDWRLFAVGSSYGFVLYDYASKQCVANKCTLNVQDFAIVSGDLGAMSRKKSFRKSLRESFRRLRRGRSQRTQTLSANTTTTTSATSPDVAGGEQQVGPKKAFGRTLGARTFNAPTFNDAVQQAAVAHRNLLSGERQVEPKVELSSIVKCITLTSAIITNNPNLFKPSLWVGTNSGQVLVYAIDLASESEQSSTSGTETSQGTTTGQSSSNGTTQLNGGAGGDSRRTVARLTKEIQLKHKAPIVAIFTSPEAPAVSQQQQQPSEERKAAGGPLERQASSSAEQKSLTNESESNEVSTASADQPRATSPSSEKSPSKSASPSKDSHQPQQQARVLICSEEQFKVFNLPNLKPFCKFKLTAYEGLRAKKISITQFLKPATQNTGNTTVVVATGSQQASKLQSTTTLNSSKSLQSFATQTSPSASPVPPQSAAETSNDNGLQQANGAGNKSSASSNGGAKQTSESNNNLLITPNNNTNRQQQDKELLNAKFGAKVTSSSSSAAIATTTTLDSKPDEQQQCVGDLFEPYMVCMSNRGDCAIYSVPDLKRQAQIQVCKREDVNGITSAMLTNYGEGYYLRSSSNFLRFSISSQRVLRVLSVV